MDEAAQRIRLLLDMYEWGERMQLQRLRRTHPQDSPQDLSARMTAWRHDRPGAPDGDCPGRPVRR